MLGQTSMVQRRWLKEQTGIHEKKLKIALEKITNILLKEGLKNWYQRNIEMKEYYKTTGISEILEEARQIKKNKEE